jgi:hypothetical protein
MFRLANVIQKNALLLLMTDYLIYQEVLHVNYCECDHGHDNHYLFVQ